MIHVFIMITLNGLHNRATSPKSTYRLFHDNYDSHFYSMMQVTPVMQVTSCYSIIVYLLSKKRQNEECWWMNGNFENTSFLTINW